MIKKIFFKIIIFYQKFISFNFGSNCRFSPTCSEYALRAIDKYGVVRGIGKGVWRIVRCNPFNKGGVDLP